MTFKDDTVFIVGAGASCEFEMPSGAALASKIAASAHVSFGHFDNKPTGDRMLREALQRTYRGDELNARLPALRQIASGIYMAESIDAYIDRHRETPFVAEMGKFLIALYLLTAEARSKLKVNQQRDEPLDLPSLGETWIDQLARTMFAGVAQGQEDTIGSNITIICFNYDRCIERYLQQAVVQAFHVDEAKADRIVRQIKILRPYGDLGLLPPSPRDSGQQYVPFGADLHHTNIPAVAARLRTFTEQVEDKDLVQEMRTAVMSACQIVFLGFGYHKQNIDLLTGTPTGGPAKTFYYSGFGIPKQSVNAVLERTVKMAGYPSFDLARDRTYFEHDGMAAHVLKVHRMALSN